MEAEIAKLRADRTNRSGHRKEAAARWTEHARHDDGSGKRHSQNEQACSIGLQNVAAKFRTRHHAPEPGYGSRQAGGHERFRSASFTLVEGDEFAALAPRGRVSAEVDGTLG